MKRLIVLTHSVSFLVALNACGLEINDQQQ